MCCIFDFRSSLHRDGFVDPSSALIAATPRWACTSAAARVASHTSTRRARRVRRRAVGGRGRGGARGAYPGRRGALARTGPDFPLRPQSRRRCVLLTSCTPSGSCSVRAGYRRARPPRGPRGHARQGVSPRRRRALPSDPLLLPVRQASSTLRRVPTTRACIHSAHQQRRIFYCFTRQMRFCWHRGAQRFCFQRGFERGVAEKFYPF